MLPHPHRATIAPAPNGVKRPLWSVMIPTYNCAEYLGETLTAVLSQDPDPDQMQIEVIDDGSTDDPEGVVEAIAGDRVTFYPQPQHVGHIQNFATCLQRSRGRLIHLLHGDDAVHPGFYRAMAQAFEHEEVGAAFCRQIFIDEDGQEFDRSPLEQQEAGVLPNWLARLASEQRIVTPSIVVRREAYEALGGFDERLVCAEDWEMWVRIAARYPIWYEPRALARYRMHVKGNTGRHVRSGEDILYTRQAIDLFEPYLPDELAKSITDQAKQTYAFAALDTAVRMATKGDYQATVAQMRAALACSHSPNVIRRIVQIGLWALPNYVQQVRQRKDAV